MTATTLSPENLRPFSHGAAMRSFVHRKLSNASTGRSVNPVPAPVPQLRLPQPLLIQHRGAQAVTSAAPGQAPKLLDQVSAAIRTIQELLGHEDFNTTMIYTHVTNKGGFGGAQPGGPVVMASAQESLRFPSYAAPPCSIRKYETSISLEANYFAEQEVTLALFKRLFRLMLQARAAFADFFRPPKKC